MRQASKFKRLFIPLFIVITVGIVLAVSAFYTVKHVENQDIAAKFGLDAQNRINAIKREIAINVEAIQSLRSFYLSSEEVTREEFIEFTRPQILDHPSIQALEWIPRIPDSKRRTYERAAQNELYPNFQITQLDSQGKIEAAVMREEYFPVHFVEPYIGNEVALGFDIASNPTMLEALKKSRNRGKIIASARISLLQEQEEQSSFIVSVPIYRKHQLLETVEDRNENLDGFVIGVFRIGKIVEHALSYFDPSGIKFDVFDESTHSDKQLLYSYLPRLYSRIKDNENNNGLIFKQIINVADRKWSIIAKPTSAYFISIKHWHALSASIGIMIIASFIAFHLKHNADFVSKLSDEITERKKHEREHKRLLGELKRKNKELEQILYITSHDLRSPLVNVQGFSKELDISLSELMSSLNEIDIPLNLKKEITQITNDDIPESLDFIKKSISRMEQLLAGLLKLSRTERIELNLEVIDMNEIMSEIKSNHEFRLKEAGVNTEVSELPQCTGDRTLIYQVFSNILDNAIK